MSTSLLPDLIAELRWQISSRRIFTVKLAARRLRVGFDDVLHGLIALRDLGLACPTDAGWQLTPSMEAA